MSADSHMFGAHDTIDPTATMNNNVDFSNYFESLTPNLAAPTGNTSGAWAMDQFLDYPNYNTTTTGGFPFPQQLPPNNAPYGIAPQAINAFTPMHTANIMAFQSADDLPRQTTNLSIMTDGSNTAYSTRQATGSSQKRPVDSIEVESPPAKKLRKQRKKRSKEMTEAEANEKRQKFLDRNKVAAHKCRQRKKEWTDNLQNRSQVMIFINDALKREVHDASAEIQALKTMVERIHRAPAPVHTCNPQQYAIMEQKWQKFSEDEKSGFSVSCNRNLEAHKASRIGAADQAGEDMSRRTSMQSHQSMQSGPSRGSDRNDSGVEVNSPEDAAKNLGTPKLNFDEAIDVSTQNFFPHPTHSHMMSNQQHLGGPIDLHDPMVYLNNMAH